MVYDFSDGGNIAIYAFDESLFVPAADGSTECRVGVKDLLVVFRINPVNQVVDPVHNRE